MRHEQAGQGENFHEREGKRITKQLRERSGTSVIV
jgi:hypothetical protein